MNINSAKIVTAGAYILTGGLYPFQIGLKPHDGKYPVVRLGGHVEENETGWQCAVREVREEAGLQIRPIPLQKTYLVVADDPNLIPTEITWVHELHSEVTPFLIVAYNIENDPRLSLMYLVKSNEAPVPSTEVKGLLLLDRQHIHQLCHETITLCQFLSGGGKAILTGTFDRDLALEPFIQLRILSQLLDREYIPSSISPNM